MTQNLKKCRNCGAIQEHSLQQTCSICGTKNAFDNSNNNNKISDKLGKDFICPKCLSFFGKENVPQKMVKKKDTTNNIIISFIISIPIAVFICFGWLHAISFNKGLEYALGGASRSYNPDALIPGLLFWFFVSFVIVFFIINLFSNKPIQKCPICGRTGDFVLANSKLGMKYINEKIIKETIETNKNIDSDSNSNNEKQNKENTINDIYSSWNADKNKRG